MTTDDPDTVSSRLHVPDDSPGFLLWTATLRWQRIIAATLQPYDITHVQFVLLASAWWLGSNEEPPTQRRLAEHAGTDPMMTSQVLRTLEGKSLIRREVHERDSRARRVLLTDSGQRTLAKAIKAVESADHDFFSPLPPERVLPLLRTLAARPHLD
ncbi:MAG: hypothetical protein JWQ95_6361 [Sphaerisporangium sp.]|nr:hypothetical protein [Sphaerisporangium sp.]